MDVKGANPFLFTEDDYTSPSAATSNPFLMGGDDFMDDAGGNDNPFLSQGAATVAPSATVTNPFAFDPMDLEPSEAQQADVASAYGNTFDANTFMHPTQEAANIFTQAPVGTQDFFVDTNVSLPSIVPQKPTDLDLKYTNTVATDYDQLSNGGPRRPPPPRPPPSKETQDLLMSVMGEMDATSSHLLDRIPPTRTPSPVSMRDLHSPSPTPEPQFGDLLDVSDAKTETHNVPSQSEDLFMSLSDDACDINQNPPSMEQTAQPTMQQPQQPIMPQPMMEPIVSQSMMQQPPQPPVVSQPMMQQQPQPPVVSQPMMQQPPQPSVVSQPLMQQQQPQPPPVAVAQEMPRAQIQSAPPPPSRPGPPVRPPRPVPPQKPPPPAFAQSQPQAAPPPKPPPPTAQPPRPAAAPPPPKQDEFMDMFGPQPPAPKSTADIMNLFNAKKEAPMDLLSDNLDTPIPTDMATDASVSESNSRKSSVPSSDNTIINSTAAVDEQPEVVSNETAVSTSPQNTQENYLSPQHDMQMDTSDSQSKESVSSVTFNPFAAVEETSPTNPSDIPSQDFSNLDNEEFHSDVQKEVHEEMMQPVADTDNYYNQTTTNATFGTVDNVNEQKTTISSIFGITDNNVYAEETTPANIFVEPMTGITTTTTTDIFGSTDTTISTPYPTAAPNTPFETTQPDNFGNAINNAFAGFGSGEPDAFDAFAAKFESARDENKNGGGFDAFGGGGSGGDMWGGESMTFNDATGGGFGNEEPFDSFLAMKEPPAVPQSTPNRLNKAGSLDSDEEKDFSVVIRPKSNDDSFGGALPILAPPPVPTSIAYSDTSRINPFDQSEFAAPATTEQDFALPMGEMKRSESQETPPTPLYDEDVSQPLLPFPRVDYTGDGWEMQLRQPNKKKITGQRFWKKIFVRLVYQQDCVLLQLFNTPSDKDPFQELPLQPCYSVSDIGAQQYDNFGKIFTLKLQYIFYKERPGVRPGQVKKAERITNKLSQFAAYAIQGDYQGCKEFGSDLKKLGLPVEHAPQVSQLMKLGSLNFEDLKQFSMTIEESLFKLQAHRDRALHYKMEEVQVTAVDELYVEQDSDGHIERQIARVRLFFLGFLTGMPDIELGINDMRRQGKEVVGRHDIIPVVTEEWIRLENVEFHNCVQQVDYNETHIIKFKPPDACYIELLRFRVRPPKNRELPLQLKAQICITGYKIELRADVLVPGFASRKLGQVPCEDVMIRFPIPECWIYMFRVEKHFRYGSVKSAHRRTGKIKGIERILGTVDTLQESLIEVTSGQAKYEHQHRAIVWRCPRLPKEGQGAYTTHNMVCRLSLTSYDQMPDQLAEYAYVEFTMPATQVSHTTVRSVSLQNSDSDEPPEKYVRYLARHEYRVGIEHTEGEGPNAYLAATHVKKAPPPPVEEKPKPIPEAESSSDSDE